MEHFPATLSRAESDAFAARSWVFHWQIGGQRYNSLFSGLLIDEPGRVHYGEPWGRVRLRTEARGR